MRLPDRNSCTPDARARPFFPDVQISLDVVVPDGYDAVETYWNVTMEAIQLDDLVIVPPGRRDQNDDFVLKDLRLEADHVALAQQQWREFVRKAGPYPAGAYAGRGIVILGGEVPYLIPTLVAVSMIRRAGCQLPIQIWFPSDELPSAQIRQKLERFGVDIRELRVPDTLGKGFFMKAAVLLLSTFEEVVFLDADQVPVLDVAALFDDPSYRATGALFWPDFWDATWAPDAPLILGLAPEALPKHSFESGQMVINKARIWAGLVAALHFNLDNQLYYPMFTNFMGLGDKETFAMALLANNLPFSTVPHRIRALGIAHDRCKTFTCQHHFRTNTMVQHSPTGQIAFLHTNMPPKWELPVVSDPKVHIRRWQVLKRGLRENEEAWLNVTNTLFGFDVEMHIHGLLLSLRCDPDVMLAYTSWLAKNPPKMPIHVLPYLIEGLEPLYFYEATGLTGSFLEDQSPSWAQRWRHWQAVSHAGRKFLRQDTVTRRRRSFLLSRGRLAQQLQAARDGHGSRLLQPA